MKIKQVEIEGYKHVRSQTGAKERRSVYTGAFNCPGKPLHGDTFTQLSVTKVAWCDEYGQPHWGDPKTTFTTRGCVIPFESLEELITFHNSGQRLRELALGKVTLRVSSCGTVIMQGEKRKTIHKRKLKSQRLMHEVNAGDRTWRVRRLVALAWLGDPDTPRQRVLLRDNGNEDNLHYTNLYWNANSHSDEEAQELVKHLNG